MSRRSSVSLWNEAVWLLALFQTFGCSSDPACGPGTALVNGRCEVTAQCGEGTVLKNGKCIPENPETGGVSGSGGSGTGGATSGTGGVASGAGGAGAEAGGGSAGSSDGGVAGSGGGETGGSGGEAGGNAGAAGSEAGGMSGGAGAPLGAVPKTCKGVPYPGRKDGCCGSDGNFYWCLNSSPDNYGPEKKVCVAPQKCTPVNFASLGCGEKADPFFFGTIRYCTAD